MDSRAAMGLIQRPLMSARSKHLDIRELWIRQAVDEGQFELWWVATEGELADIMTKNLGSTLFRAFRDRLLNKVNVEQLAFKAVYSKEGCCSQAALMMLGLPKQGQPPADHWLRWVCNKPVGDFDLVLDKGQEQTIPLSALGKNFLQERKSSNMGQQSSSFIERKSGPTGARATDEGGVAYLTMWSGRNDELPGCAPNTAGKVEVHPSEPSPRGVDSSGTSLQDLAGLGDPWVSLIATYHRNIADGLEITQVETDAEEEGNDTDAVWNLLEPKMKEVCEEAPAFREMYEGPKLVRFASTNDECDVGVLDERMREKSLPK